MHYVRKQLSERQPQLLQVACAGRRYAFSIIHAHDEVEDVPDAELTRRRQTSGVHRHAVYHLALFTAGRKRLILNEREYPCRRGTLLLVSPNEPHVYNDFFPGRIAVQEITFILECGEQPLLIPFHELLACISGLPLRPIAAPVQLREFQTKRMETLYHRLMEHLELGGDYLWFGAQRAMTDIFAYLIEEVYKPAADGATDENRPLLAARVELERRFKDPLRLAEVARSANLSVSYLCRAFMRRFGTSPLAYQRDLRMAAARTLLRTTPTPIKCISEMVGYGDIYAFSKAFRRATGIAPARYRRSPPATTYGRHAKGRHPVIQR